jgi:ankyrin repeat protein
MLIWAVGMEKYKSVETLLKCGADPNITTIVGESPLFIAVGFSWVDNFAKKDPKYVNLLLRYGADPNINYIGGSVSDNITESGTSPLMHSISCGIEKTRALVEAGADINHKTNSGITAAIIALLAGQNATLEGMEYAHYLVVDKKAKVSEPCGRGEIHNDEDPNEKFYPVTILRTWIYGLNSKEHKLKMEIVDEFSRQGVSYWNSEIDNYTLATIKDIYPDTWEDYIKKY